MRPVSYKRILAYILDIMIVTVVATFITMVIPKNNKYDESLEKYTTLLNEFTNESIKQEEFLKKSNDVVYTMNKESVDVTIVTLVLTISYFVVLQYFLNGQTIGKKVMKLQIISSGNKKLTMNNYLVRSLIINSVLMNLIGIITILFLNKNLYIKVNDIITYLFGTIYIVTFAMILFREDKRGLHDILANTKVISLENALDENKQEEIIKDEDSKLKDVEVIKEHHI